MAELIDSRIKITELTNQVAEAHSRASGRDKNEILREILHKWASQEVHMSNLISRLTRGQGVETACQGAGMASQGFSAAGDGELGKAA